MLIPSAEVNILNTFRVMIILRLLLLLTNLHLKLLSTQGTGADKLLSTQRVKCCIMFVAGIIVEMFTTASTLFFLIQFVKKTRNNTRSIFLYVLVNP